MRTDRRYQRELPPDCFPRAAFKLADLLDELVESKRQERRTKVLFNGTPTEIGGSPKSPIFPGFDRDLLDEPCE